MNDFVNRARGFFQKVPSAPTNPQETQNNSRFDIEDLYKSEEERGQKQEQTGLDEKLRQAYFWITNTAIISPFYDIEYEDGESKRFTFGDSGVEVSLPKGQSYSSFVLIPLLNLAVRGKCLIVGGPGRGKTATAMLMGLLAGYSKTDVMRAIQHGQPQMTISDLLGHPLPVAFYNLQGRLINNVDISREMTRHPLAGFSLHQQSDYSLSFTGWSQKKIQTSVKNSLQQLFGKDLMITVEIKKLKYGSGTKPVSYTSDLALSPGGILGLI